jgi:hypothetical protein
MKIIINKSLIIMMYLLGIFNIFAAPHPPPPQNGKKPPPPPGLPIDETLFILLIIATIFGLYVIYKYQLKAKTPV